MDFREYSYFVYIMSNYSRTVFYTGMTNDIVRRVYEHKMGEGCAFTKKYKCKDLIYFEGYFEKEDAAGREQKLKRWTRDWKEDLIATMNPNFSDLSYLAMHYCA